MKISVPCNSGSDRNCVGTVEIDLPYIGLSDEDVSINQTVEGGKPILRSVCISPTLENWANLNANFLTQSDIDSLDSDGWFEVEQSRLEHKVCGPCGSDETYDGDGNNVSGL